MAWLLHHFKMASVDRYVTKHTTVDEMINSISLDDMEGPEPETIVSTFDMAISDAVETVFSHRT